jgi:membrane-associated phospholipid phosphatase
MATSQLTLVTSKQIASVQRPNGRRIIASLWPVAVLYVIYTAVRWLVADRGPKVGGEHARWLLEIEQKLGLDWELRVQQATVHHEWLVQAANNYYVYGFLPVLVFCTILGAWRAPAAFAWWRSVFAISLMLALVGFAVFPLTPPRLLPPSYGYVDTLLLYGPHYYGDATGSSLFNAYGSIPSVVNVYAAMPSMHIAWSIVAGALLIAIARGRWLAWVIAVLHPTLMAIAVVLTGNHYVLDIVFGIIALLISIGLARFWLQVKARRQLSTFDASPAD